MLGGYLSKNLARHLRPTRASLPSIRSRSFQRDAPPLAFAFDIDGVLIRGEDVLPAAKRALSILEGDNPFRIEKERCTKLSAKLGFEIHPHQYIQAHTILKTLSHKYTDAPVLVLGGKLDQVRQVAAGYGFKKAYTTLDVLAWNPSVWPFHRLTTDEAASTKDVDFSQTPISAVFVFHDPRNWALDVQVLCDVIQSAGVIGGPYVPLQQQTKPCQGGFKAAFQGVFKSLTGSEYPFVSSLSCRLHLMSEEDTVQFGKPTRATYDFATQVLSDRVKELTGSVGPLPPVFVLLKPYPFVCNVASDIAGANAANWQSVLVKTGRATSQRITAEDVEEAVRWAIARHQ
ncbi:hypothetical protein B0H16DRAFT_1658306 [Mycena metata]|uniref:Uncharacterized protein n=1 Tax=Mycena metata TaxID=1033252 RepID=A0AAD7KCA1_9AGAR|nr:hypothetical protein B0H16DRAFT_1658306 [Mycena metata]